MKTDIYQEVTDYIVEALERLDPADYRAPFARMTASQPPRNPTTNKHYNGINTLILWFKQQEHDYQSNEWATFQQWKEQGAMVKKGEKSSRIVFYKQVEKKDDSAANEESEFYNMIRVYNVFNADQVEGYSPNTGLEEGNLGAVQKIQKIESFVANTKVEIRPGERAAYALAGDYIEMPDESLFFENTLSATENYYATLLHELTHWTGAKHRLNREPCSTAGNKKSYAFEELVAELGSAYLCAGFQIEQSGRDNHALYIQSWLKALKNNKRYVFKAAAQAQKAVDYLHTLSE